MKKIMIFLSLIMFSFLYGCALSQTASNSNQPIINSDIREIDLIPMGSNKYSLLIRGNVRSEQSDLRAQLSQEVSGVCGVNFEILKIETSEVEHLGTKKPIIESVFICK